MTFYEPSFLWALGLLIIPILIHLLNLRKYKKVTFSNVEMLKELHTQSRKTRQVKKWLILLSRLLALACLILAFARPYLPYSTSVNGKTLISIYLDNSQSMLSEGEAGQLFENGKNAAREILDLLPNDMDVQFLDNKLSPYTNRVFVPEQAERLIDDLDPDYHVNDLNGVLQRARKKKNAENYGSHFIYLISDFQKGRELEVYSDSAANVNVIRMEPLSAQNLSIDTVWIEAPIVKPGSPLPIYVKVSNNGSVDVESTTLTLNVNGVQQGVESFRIPGQSSETFRMEISTTRSGWVEGEFAISDVPVTFDNNYYFAIQIKPSIRVLNIGEKSKTLERLYQNKEAFEFVHSDPGAVDYAQMGSFDFIILNELPTISSGLVEQLSQFSVKGGAVLVVPSAKSDKYTTFSSTLNLPFYLTEKEKNISISAQDLGNSFLADVYKRIPENVQMPTVAKTIDLRVTPGTKVLLKLKDRAPILTQTKVGDGTIFQWAMPLTSEYSAIVDHEIFVLAMLKMTFSKNEQKSLSSMLHSKTPIVVPMSSKTSQLILTQGTKQIILESAATTGGTRVWLNDEVDKAGVYSLTFKENEEDSRIALNYDRLESIQEYHSNQELSTNISQVNFIQDNLAGIKSAVDQVGNGRSLWQLFLGLSLLFLLIEVLLLRFIKT